MPPIFTGTVHVHRLGQCIVMPELGDHILDLTGAQLLEDHQILPDVDGDSQRLHALLVAVPTGEACLEGPVNEFGSVAEDTRHWWKVVTDVDKVVGRLVFGTVVANVDVGTVLAHSELLFWIIWIGNIVWVGGLEGFVEIWEGVSSAGGMDDVRNYTLSPKKYPKRKVFHSSSEKTGRNTGSTCS